MRCQYSKDKFSAQRAMLKNEANQQTFVFLFPKAQKNFYTKTAV